MLFRSPLMFLDLKLGNICNLKCRICGSWSSSQFATEELNNLSANVDKKTSFHYTMLKQGAWPRENPVFWKEIAEVADQIRYIEFTGGEPFMIREHFQMLQGLVDRGIASQVEIHYNTNGTHFPLEALQVWRDFRQVNVSFSIDGVGDQFEFMRYPAKWNEVDSNMEKFLEIGKEFGNINFSWCITLSVANIYNVPETLDYYYKKYANQNRVKVKLHRKIKLICIAYLTICIIL